MGDHAVPRLADLVVEGANAAEILNNLERANIAGGRAPIAPGQLRQKDWAFTELDTFQIYPLGDSADNAIIALGKCMIWQLTTVPKNNIGHLVAFLACHVAHPSDHSARLFPNQAHIVGGQIRESDVDWALLEAGTANTFSPHRQPATINYVQARTGIALPDAGATLDNHPIIIDLNALPALEQITAYTAIALFICRSTFTLPAHMNETWSNLPDLLRNTYKINITLVKATWTLSHPENWEAMNNSMPARIQLLNTVQLRCIRLYCKTT